MGLKNTSLFILLLVLAISLSLVMLISIILARNQFGDRSILLKDSSSNDWFDDPKKLQKAGKVRSAFRKDADVKIDKYVFEYTSANSEGTVDRSEIKSGETNKIQPNYIRFGSSFVMHMGDGECSEVAMPEVHKYLSNTTPASCTEDGYIEYTCSCGSTYSEVLPKLEHNYSQKTILPTCISEGYTVYFCQCGENYKDLFIDKLSHSYIENIKVDPTCTSRGYVKYLCDCGNAYTETLNTIPHSYQISVEPATCTEDGEEVYTCTCGDSYTVLLKAIGHSFLSDIIISTCTSNGYTTHTCSCGYMYVDNYTPPTTHQWSDWIVSEKATTTKKGTEYRKCIACSKREIKTIAKKKAVDLTSVQPVSMFKGVNSQAMKAVDAILECIDKYYDIKSDEEIYLGVFELTEVDVSVVESSIAIYLGSYYDGLKSTTFYYVDANHHHLFVNMDIMKKTEKARREMMETISKELALFEAGNTEYLIKQVFDYLATNISYDCNQPDATVALQCGKGSCNAYPILFKLMLSELGIDSDICVGYSYTGYYHAWNRVTLKNGKNKYYDLTFYISTKSSKYYAADSLKHNIVTIERYLTSKELSGK